MLRAMEDVVGPAIDRANSLALEQSALVIGHLRMLAIQWSKADGYARACGADLERLIDTLAPNDGPMTQAAATSLAAARQTDGGAELRYKAMMAGVDAPRPSGGGRWRPSLSRDPETGRAGIQLAPIATRPVVVRRQRLRSAPG